MRKSSKTFSTTSRWYLAVLGLAIALGACSSEREPGEPSGEDEPVTTESDAAVSELEADIDELEKEIENQTATVAKLREENEALRKRLPASHRVVEGDNHWDIGFRFLTEEQGLEPDEARGTLADAALFHPILPGFDIWNFYDGEELGSVPTQNEARVSPGDLVRMEQERIQSERFRLMEEAADVKRQLEKREARIATLESRIALKTEEVSTLRTYIETLREHQRALQSRLDHFESRLSSVYYLAATGTELRAEGKVRGSFLDLAGVRLGDIGSEDFDRRIDLRESSSIEVHAEDMSIARIEDVELLPRHWEEGIDYRVVVADDGQMATIELRNPERFHLETIVLMVRS